MNLPLLELACRRVLAHPLRSALLALAIFLLTSFSASVLLLTTAIENTADRVIQSGPSLVISRVVAGGWAPMPEQDLSKIQSIPGIRKVVPRVWGVIPHSPTVTIIGDDQLPALSTDAFLANCQPQIESTLDLRALDGTPHPVTPRSTCPKDSLSLDTLSVSLPLARQLLLLPDDSATDFAVFSARPEEDNALVSEISSVLAYPARIVTRAQMRGAYLGQTGQRNALYLLLLSPALLSLSLIISLLAAGGPMARSEIGKLKTLGWTTADIATLHIAEFASIGISSTLLGSACAYLALFVLGGGPVAAALLGWDKLSPGLSLDTTSAVSVLALVISTVLLPTFFAAIVPSIRLARVDPAELLDKT